MKLSLVVGVIVVIAIVGFSYPVAGRDTKTDANTLRDLEAEFMQAASERGTGGYMAYYAEDAVELPDGSGILRGREAIAKTMGFLDDKKNQLTWTPLFADIAASGDLGYTYGTWEFRSKDKGGQPTVERGKYTTIWKKQKDGSWKVALDMGNSSRAGSQ
jgi:ketosteroid isomerase-like protein